MWNTCLIIQHLHTLVDCIPTILQQYCSIRTDEVISCLFDEYINTYSLSELMHESSWIFDKPLLRRDKEYSATLLELGGE